MADKEIEPSPANAPAPDAPAPDAPAPVAPAIEAPAIDAAPADAPSTEATDAAPTAATKPLTKAQKKKQKQKRDRERKLAQKPKSIATPVGKILAVDPEKKLQGAGTVGRVRTDNSHVTRGQVEIVDSNGDPKWYYPGALVEVEQKVKDAFKDEEKKPRGKPYTLGGSDAPRRRHEALEVPPEAKGATVRVTADQNWDLLRYVEGPTTRKGRRERAAAFAACWRTPLPKRPLKETLQLKASRNL